MGPEGVCPGIWEVAVMLGSQLLPETILYLTTAPSHRPLLSLRGPKGLWQIAYVLLAGMCFYMSTSEGYTCHPQRCKGSYMFIQSA